MKKGFPCKCQRFFSPCGRCPTAFNQFGVFASEDEKYIDELVRAHQDGEHIEFQARNCPLCMERIDESE